MSASDTKPFFWATVKSAFDKNGQQREATWDGFCEWLLGGHEYAPGKGPEKLRTPAFALVKFLPDQTEMITANVSLVSGMAIDFDGSIAEASCVGQGGEARVEIVKRKQKLDVELLIQRLQTLNYYAILYETASSTPEYPRMRLVVPFKSPVAPDSLPAMVGPFLDRLPQPELVDIVTTTRPGGIHFVPMNKDAIAITFGEGFYDLAPGKPPVVPEPIGLKEARHLMNQEREAAGIQTFDASDLEGDGWMRTVPIDWKTLDMYRLFSEGLGVEVEAKSRPHKTTGRKWRCECPLQSEHSKVNGSLDAVIFQEEDGYPGFYCPHQHTLTLRQLYYGTDNGSPSVLNEDLLLRYAERWVSPMIRESAARKIQPSTVWFYTQAALASKRMSPDELIASSLVRKEMKGPKNHKREYLVKDLFNLDKIFQYDERFETLTYDLFKQVIYWEGAPIPAQGFDTIVTDIRSYIVENYQGLCYGNEQIVSALVAEANRRPFHPVYDYLTNLEWDRTPRINRIPGVLNAKSHPLVPEYLRCFFVGAVARVLHNPGPHSQNGAKVDTCLVLLGPQGIRKTTFFQSLVPQEDWFGSEPVGDLERDALLTVHRHWIHEMGEVDSIHRSHEAEKLKNWMSQTQDTFRQPYGRATGMFPRRFMVCGSTNRDEFLRDPTGARRWHVIQLHDRQIDTDWVVANRDQIWAEAVEMYRSGVTYYLDADLAKMHEEAVAIHLDSDAVMIEAIESYLNKLEEKGVDNYFTLAQLITYLVQDRGLQIKGKGGEIEVLRAMKRINGARRNGQNAEGKKLPPYELQTAGASKYFQLDKTKQYA